MDSLLKTEVNARPTNCVDEAVTVCVNYSDYLQHTLPRLLAIVSRVTVVTSYSDANTREIATALGAQCIVTNEMFKCRGRDCYFNKGAAINEGLRHMSRAGWVLQVDADIVLLDELFPVDTQVLYGAPRMHVPGIEGLNSLLNGKRVGFRSSPVRGYLPSGYFHLWHWPTNRNWYPQDCGDASRSDWKFAMLWHRTRLSVLPEVTAWHLEMPDDPYAANWKGRITPHFQ